MKNLKLTSSKFEQALLQAAPEGTTDVYLYRDNGWKIFIAYKGKIFQTHSRWVLNEITSEEILQGVICMVWTTKYIKYMEEEVGKR